MKMNIEVYLILLEWRNRMITYLETRQEDGLSDGDKLITGLLPVKRRGIHE